MQRSITTDNGKTTLVTTNGIKTSSRPFYLKEIRTYTPRPDGYNEELAEKMWESIWHSRALWNQGVWRHIFVTDTAFKGAVRDIIGRDGLNADLAQSTLQQQLSESLAQEVKTPTCGTAMCAAGWVTELSAVDYLVDFATAKALKAKHMVNVIDDLNDRVLVPRAMIEERVEAIRQSREVIGAPTLPDMWASELDNTIADALWDTGSYEWLRKYLKRRGFTNKSHLVITIPDWAVWQLGLVDLPGSASQLPMFSGSNSLSMVRWHLDTYAAGGPSAHRVGYGNVPEPDLSRYDEDWTVAGA